jgi:hypothetical protein
MHVLIPLTGTRMELLEPLTFKLIQTNWMQFTILQKPVQNAKVRNTYGYR